MRLTAFIIALVAITLFSARQNPPHECYKNNKESYCFHNNEFSWQRSTNNNKEIGSGTFFVKGDSIELNFATAIREFDVSVNRSQATSNTVEVKVSAMRSNGTPIQGMKVTLLKSDLSAETNTRGEAVITIKAPLNNDDLILELNGQRSPGLNLSLSAFNNLVGVVIDEAIKYRENQSVTLPFKKAGRKVRINGRSFKVIRQTSTH